MFCSLHLCTAAVKEIGKVGSCENDELLRM